MVSLGRSAGITLLSLSRSASSFLFLNPQASTQTSRRTFFFTTTGLITTSLCLPSSSLAKTTSSETSCQVLDSRQHSKTSSSSTSRVYMSSGNMDNNNNLMTGYLNAVDAAALDGELMSTPGFSLEQLMELAGLAVAEAVYQVVPSSTNKKPRILLICGPGNNGGDGLVAARHLVFFGYESIVVYPKRSSKTHFINLVKQCEDVGVTIVDEIPKSSSSYDAIVDAIFGFSFKGAPREPFATALIQMQDASKQGIPVLSVDVPSGWNVDEGDVMNTGFIPDVLISLTTPKLSAKNFPGRHFIGGRFLPPALAEKYNVQMPPYPGVSQVMEVTHLCKKEGTSTNSYNWEQEYADYLLAEKHASDKKQRTATASSSFSTQHTTTANNTKNKNEKERGKKKDDDNNVDESWEVEYAAYCAKKEEALSTAIMKVNHEQKQQNETKQKNDDNNETWETQYAAYCAEKEALLALEDERYLQKLKIQQQEEEEQKTEKKKEDESWEAEYAAHCAEKEARCSNER